jgi:flagellar basal-body rod protein FlgG
MRFLQNWRATIVRSINESQSDKAEPANAKVSSRRATHSDDPPVAANMPRLAALNTALRVIEVEYAVSANNLANAKTTAFKGSRVNLENMESQTVKPPGTMTAMGDVSPSGVSYGAGVKVSSTQLNTEQGLMDNSGRQLDMAIQGPGFFKVKIQPTISDGTGYTRNGNFFVSKDGDLVLGAGDGYKLDPKINIPKGVTNISISSDGKVSVIRAGTLAPVTVGQVELHQFINEQGLNLLGSSVYTQTESSGPPLQSKPGEDGAGQLLQGFLEASNVKPEEERMRMRSLDQWRAMILSVIDEVK